MYNSHLLLGSTNYDPDTDEPNGFEIEAIINNKGEILDIGKWHWHKVIIDGFILVRRYKLTKYGERVRGRDDLPVVEAYAIYDMTAGRIVSKEYNSIYIYGNEITMWEDTSEKERAKDPEKLQKSTRITFQNLRTFFTTM